MPLSYSSFIIGELMKYICGCKLSLRLIFLFLLGFTASLWLSHIDLLLYYVMFRTHLLSRHTSSGIVLSICFLPVSEQVDAHTGGVSVISFPVEVGIKKCRGKIFFSSFFSLPLCLCREFILTT